MVRLIAPRLRPRRRGVLWTVAAAGIALYLALFALVALAAWRSRFSAPAPTLLVTDRSGRFLGELGEAADGGLGYWPVPTLPPRVVAATLALEDRRFDLHPGVDPLALGRAVLQNLRSGKRISGASTLAMQVARMQHPGSRGYLRKLSEALSAYLLTARHGRQEVMRQYLRLVPYGNRIHGIAYAARRYFDKPVDDLSWAEIAFLAALPQAPTRMNPFDFEGRSRAIARGQRVLRSLAGQRVMSAPEYELASRQLAELRLPYRERRAPDALHALLHLRTLLTGPNARTAPPLRVRTTLDLDLQRQVTQLTYRAVRLWASRGAGNASVLVLDRERHEVLAWVGSTGYFETEQSGAIDFSQVRRSAGSTLKPFLYAQAIERGVLTAGTVLDDVQRGPGGVTNADDLFLGPLLPRVALANSRNVPAVELLGKIGLDQGYGLFRDLGLTDGALPARHYGLGLAIGGLPVTLEELCRAYLTIAGDGTLPSLRWYDGQRLPPERRIFAETTARLVTLFLSDPQARLPTFPRMGATEYRLPVAVKTGTSSNYHDAWAVAYSARYLVGAWVGHPGFRPMNGLSGYLSAADLVQQVLGVLHAGHDDGQEDLAFPPPRGYRPARLCALSGARATAACPQVFLEWFRPGEEPVDDCAVHQQRAVDRRNGLLATADTPRDEVEVRTFVELPPRYAAWQATAGLPRTPDEANTQRILQTAIGVGAAAPTAPTGAGPHPLGTVRLAGGPVRLRVTSPENGSLLLRDPETPAAEATLRLSAVVDPPAPQVVWYVDGRPFATTAYPYGVRWPLAPGAHTFQVRLPFTESVSRAVEILVQ